MSACITAQEYVVWVKGSLNRWLGAGLVENGDTAPPYRDWVKEFQSLSAVGTRNGNVDEATQDALIKANHQHDRYVSWVQDSLNQGRQRAAPAAGGMTQQTVAAIKQFQAANGLETNGWVGAKTETALRKKGARKPPITRAKIIPLIFRPKWGGRTPRELARFWSNQWLAAPWSEPFGAVGPPFDVLARLVLRSFVSALWRPDSDNEYVPSKRVGAFVDAGRKEPAFGGIDNDQLPRAFRTQWIEDALHTLIQATGDIMAAEHWSYADGYHTFKAKLAELYKDIYDSLVHIRYEVTARDHTNPELCNQAVVYMGGWLVSKQREGSRSILQFFPDYLRIE